MQPCQRIDPLAGVHVKCDVPRHDEPQVDDEGKAGRQPICYDTISVRVVLI
jgi:hypothetical protein